MRSILLTAIVFTMAAVGCGSNQVSSQRKEREAEPQINDQSAGTSSTESSATIASTPTSDSATAREFVELPAEVTFARDVAPIVFEKCAVCHRPDGSAPFALLTYEDVAQRAEQIVDVTHSKYMPPWPPEHGTDRFVAARTLDSRQLATLKAWADTRTEGDPADLPAPPQFADGWVLGKPELVVKLPRPFAVPASGRDVFRNFVIPLPVRQPRYVTAVEFRTDNARIVHHAVMGIDATSRSRDRDQADPQPGFAGMADGRLTLGQSASVPAGQALGWTPGKIPLSAPEGVAWQLNPGSDLVVQLHMQPSGKEERISFEIAFHFTDTPPEREAFSLQLGARSIDIPADEANYTLTDSYTLPVDVELLSIYPHAHYVCRDILATARRPDGEHIELIHIPDWDFNWQDEYRYREPVRLPAGTVLTMRYVYDNSAANPRNPNAPPQRIVWGEQTTDEMGDLVLQVVATSRGELAKLRGDYLRARFQTQLDEVEAALAQNPQDAVSASTAGEIYLVLGETERAIERLSQAIEIEPGNPQYHGKLADAYKQVGLIEEAIEEFEQAVAAGRDDFETLLAAASALASLEQYQAATAAAIRAAELTPKSVAAPYALAQIHLAQRDDQAARSALLAVIERQPDHAAAHNSLGNLYVRQRQYRQAIEHYQAALESRPTDMASRMNLANLYMQNKRLDLAAENYLAVLEVFPSQIDALGKMGVLKAMQREFDAARDYLARVLDIDPENGEALTNLGRISEQAGDPRAAVRYYRRAIELKPAPPLATMRIVWLLSTSKDPALRDGKLALRIAEQMAADPAKLPAPVLDVVAAAYAENGQFQRAAALVQVAIRQATAQGNQQLAAALGRRLRMYRQSQPVRQ